MFPIYNSNNNSSTGTLTKLLADTYYVNKNNGIEKGTLSVLKALSVGTDVTITNNLSVSGNTIIGDTTTDTATFNCAPVVNSNCDTNSTSSQYSLATKNYVDTVNATMQKWIFSKNSYTQHTAGTSYYWLYAPIVPVVDPCIYVNFNNSVSTQIVNFNTCEIQFIYNYTTGQAISLKDAGNNTIGVGTNNNIYRTIPIALADIGIGGVVTFSNKYTVSIMKNTASGASKIQVKAPEGQATALIANPGASWTKTTLVLQNQYNGGNYQYYPINFTYISDTQFKISCNYPQQLNCPQYAGWIPTLKASVEIISSNIDSVDNSSMSLLKTTGNAYLSLTQI